MRVSAHEEGRLELLPPLLPVPAAESLDLPALATALRYRHVLQKSSYRAAYVLCILDVTWRPSRPRALLGQGIL